MAEHDRTDPGTSVEEMTVFLASDVGINPKMVQGWIISIVVETDRPEMVAMVNRFKDTRPDPMMVLAQIQAMCQAITGAEL